MVNGETAIQGRHYRVIDGDFNYLEGEVVALENDNVPYCVFADKFDGSFNWEHYDIDFVDVIMIDDLEEMEGNSSERK